MNWIPVLLGGCLVRQPLFCKNNRKKFGKQHLAQKYMPLYAFNNGNFGNKHENLKNKQKYLIFKHEYGRISLNQNTETKEKEVNC